MEEPPVGGTTAEWPTTSQFGPYLLKRLLGRGGFGEVWEAVDTNKNRTVALKLLTSSYSANPAFRERLFREARTAGRLNEPHVVPIHDYGEIAGQLFIDMRLCRGADLRTLLEDNGPLAPGRAVWIISQIASALDAAHAEDIVHRDVKPANILITRGDFACLVDFGLANAADDAKLTSAGTTVGTFAYIAPERLADEQIDHRADIYSLACVLHECLTGAQPYAASYPAALIAAHLTAPVPRPSAERPGIPAAFDDVIACGMAKDRDDRYVSAGDLAAAATRALAAAPEQHRDAFPTSQAAKLLAQAGPAPRPTAASGNRRRRRLAVLAVTAAVVVIAATATVLAVSNRHDHSSASAATQVTTAIGPSATPTVTSSRITATIPVGKHPEGVAVDPTTHTAYTANFSDSTVSVIDTSSRTVTATIPVGRGPEGVAVDPTTHTACTANNRDDTVSVIDTAGRAATASITVDSQPWGVAIDPSTHTAYAANMWDYNVSVIDLTDNTVIATITVGKNPYGVAIDPSTHTAYTTNGDNTVSAIDTTSRTVSATIKVGNAPRGVAVDTNTHTAYVANEGDGTLSVINLDRNTVTATIPVGKHPYGVAVDPTADTAYVANEADATVSVIDTAKRTARGIIRMGRDPWGVAVDPTTHTAYTTNHDNTVSVIEPVR